MSVKDLELNTVAGFNGTIGDFLSFNEDQTVLTINPGKPLTKVVDRVVDAVDYTTRAMSIPFEYKLVAKGKHLFIDIKANIGFTASAGVVYAAGKWQTACANNNAIYPTGVPIVDTPKRARLTHHRVIDSLLDHTTVIDISMFDDSQADYKQIKGLFEAVAELLAAEDIQEAETLRQARFNKRRESQKAWQATKNTASAPGFTKPEILMAVLNGVEVNMYLCPTARIYRVDPDTGETDGIWNPWDKGSNLAVSWIMNQQEEGFHFATEKHLRDNGKL